MIRCKNIESLPQAVNDKTTNLLEHACMEKWDGLYSSNTVSKKSHQHGKRKGTHHEQSTRKINRQGKTVPVLLLRALKYHLKIITSGYFFPKCKKSVVCGYFSTISKEGSRRCIRKIRQNFLYARGVIDE